MAFKTQKNRISFGRAMAAARNWAIGWSAAEARPAGPTQGTPPRERPCPGSYGVLVATPRR